MHGEGRVVYRVLVGRSEGKRPLGRPRRRWEDNIKLDLRDIGIDGANWIQLAQNRVQWRAFVNNGNEPSGPINKAGYCLTT
jgi:transposase